MRGYGSVLASTSDGARPDSSDFLVHPRSSGESCLPTSASGSTCPGSSTTTSGRRRWSWSTAWPSSRRAGSPTGATSSRHFDVKVPEILVYDGDALHRQIDVGRRGHRRLPGRPAGRLPRRVRPAAALPPGRLEPGLPGHPDLRDEASREGLAARPDLPLGLPRRREPARDGRGQAEPVRHPGQVGLPQGPVRQRRPGQGLRAEVPGPQVEEGRAPDPARDRRPFGRPTCSRLVPHPRW